MILRIVGPAGSEPVRYYVNEEEVSYAEYLRAQRGEAPTSLRLETLEKAVAQLEAQQVQLRDSSVTIGINMKIAEMLTYLNANEAADVDGTCRKVDEVLAELGLTTMWVPGRKTWAIVPLASEGE